MALAQDLIDFDLLESSKENMVQLPSGRSAKALARILSPGAAGKEVTPEETSTLNNAVRNEYEKELEAIDEADDPIDSYCRYIKWTLQSYGSPQAKEARLAPLLERATKAFLHSPDYKNDPRYLKIWLQYILYFADSPREIYAFLARHNIGENLALYYEEFAAWLEGAGRWTQADEVYQLGIEREARPTERLARKYTQFQQRYEARPSAENEPTSPALPRVRAALAAKIDPFAPAAAEEPQQQARPSSSAAAKGKKPKMQIFSDAEVPTPPPGTSTTNGWDSIGSVKERKKENSIEAQPWAGQTLKAGKKVGTGTKMEVFKDPNDPSKPRSSRQPEPVVNPKTGRMERVFVNMDAVYSEAGEEFSFEELRALQRGWMGMNWRQNNVSLLKENGNAKPASKQCASKEPEDVENLTSAFKQKIEIEESQSQESAKVSKPKQKKIKVKEVKQETQTVKLRDSPSKPSKPRRKASAEPTMTMNSKAAHNDIYDMYNNASAPKSKDDTQSGAETDFDDDTFSTAGESVGTGRISSTNSEFGDETYSSIRSFGVDDTSASPWSDFTTGKISKVLKKARSAKHKRPESEEHTESIPASQEPSQTGFDTQAIAALANQSFGDLDTMAIARIAGGSSFSSGEVVDLTQDDIEDEPEVIDLTQDDIEDLQTPVEAPQTEPLEVVEEQQYVPIRPEDYEPTPLRPSRDSDYVAHNKLPFMTPIAERTESSLAAGTAYQKHFATTKTPIRSKSDTTADSPSKLNVVDLLLESPQPSGGAKRKGEDGEDNEEKHSPKMIVVESPNKPNQKILFPVTKSTAKVKSDEVFKAPASTTSAASSKRPIHKGPIIQGGLVLPTDDAVIEQILKTVHPAPSTYPGFFDHSSETFNHFGQIKAFARKSNGKSKSSPKKALPEPVLRFPGSSRVYAVKKELGEGAFAPVYLVDSSDKDIDTETSERQVVEALKAENEPKTLTWEFHILHLLKSRLGRSSRAMESILLAHECHLYRDECYLVLEYHPQGTLLDLVNQCRSENTRAGKTAEGLEEPVVMWLGVELLRTMEDMHKVGLIHGDLKADNCLVRLDTEAELAMPYNRHGEEGWSRKGLTLLDFGRGIDTKAFKPEAKFVADWKAEETDCPEIREARPWKWEIDYFGAAGVVHSMLFGKYIETVPVSGGGLGQRKEWKIRENLKRYWEKDIWTEVFNVLINSGAKKEDEMRKDLQRIRVIMEDWLETESERNGRDLRSSIRRCERLVGAASAPSKGRR